MIDFVASGRIVPVMLAFVFVEVLVLMIYWRRTGKGIDPLSLILNVGAGGSLMVALMFALMFANWRVVTAMLLLSLLFHVADLKRRWSSQPASGTGA